jgi:hypothetical protein
MRGNRQLIKNLFIIHDTEEILQIPLIQQQYVIRI